jgi:hypothetical protein
MRRYFGLILTIVIALAVLIGLNALSSASRDRRPESEADPRRSSYNAGPTGTRAFYQLLEESGYRVARWRESYDLLEQKAAAATLVITGPAPFGQILTAAEAAALHAWIAGGGRALVISRTPRAQFGDPAVSIKGSSLADLLESDPDRLVDERSDLLIAQPTELTWNVHGLAVSRLAARMKFQPASAPAEHRTPAAEASPEKEPGGEEAGSERKAEAEAVPGAALTAPVIHLGDSDGAVLADFDYGEGRVVFLSDPFVVANHGIGRGSNLTLALNLIRALGGRERQVFFDEYHHGYRGEANSLVSYFRGTPVPWLFGQALLLAALIVYSYGKRFARPLPLPQVDRHSPLEFVGSMANLQQVAQARDLALENIYPRFKAQLCRALGVPVRARPEEVVAGLSRRRLKVSEAELRQTLTECERALAGGPLDDHRLVALVASLRRIAAQLR